MRRRATRRSPSVVRIIPYEEVRARTPRTAIATQGALALQPGHAQATGPPRVVARPGRAAPASRAVLYSAGAADLPPDTDLGTVAGGIVRLVTEVLAGTRPVRQLARRATPEVCLGLAPHALPVSAGALVGRPRVLTSWVQEPSPGAAETGAVIALGGRVQALALRLELHRGRWRCTALETTAPAR